MIERLRQLVPEGNKRRDAFLAACLLVPTLACSPAVNAQRQALRCPTTPVEVEYMVGGDYRNWRSISETKGAWEFDSPYFQKVRDPGIGQLIVPPYGTIGGLRNALQARYYCFD